MDPSILVLDAAAPRHLAPPLWLFTALLAYKVLYGDRLAASTGPCLIRSALADGAPGSVHVIGG